MTEFQDLVTTSTADAATPTVLLLRENTDASAAIGALGIVFGSDDECAACELYVGSLDVGLVLRATVLDLLETSTKGFFGEGDGSFLEGAPLEGSVIEMACPVPGCPRAHVVVVTYDEDDPPRCPVHAGTVLKRVQ